jgi:hypothetical protein
VGNSKVVVHNLCGGYRKNLINSKGQPPRPDMQAHHRLPQKFEANFNKAGIDDIHNAQFLEWVDANIHSKRSYDYNLLWEAFFDSHQNPTTKDVGKFLGKIIDFFK